MAETANPYIQGSDNPDFSGDFEVEAGQVEVSAADQSQDTPLRELNIEKIRENAQIQRNLARLQEILDQIRTDRAREIAKKDIDPASGEQQRIQNGLFGWRALRRSYETFIKNIASASSDMSEAQKRLDSELMAQGSDPEKFSTADRALTAFGQTCDQSQKQELTELMGMISDRYALEKQNGNATSEVMRKIEQTIMANSALLNMAIGAVFRTAFRSISHVGGLGGALLTSAIYGGASAGLRERRKARQEELSASAWKQDLEGLETPEQKLGLLRQIAENPAKFRTYFEGRSAEAFEFFLLYQQTLSETDLESILEDAPPNIREIYAGKKIGERTLVAAGRGALRSMTLSGIGYAITHGLSSLAHGELAMAQESDGGDAERIARMAKEAGEGKTQAQVLDELSDPSELNSPESGEATEQNLVWREHSDGSPRLQIGGRGFIESGDQHAEVTVEQETASADDIATVITKDITTQGHDGNGESFEMNANQAKTFREHIKEYLEEQDQRGSYNNGETVKVPASEINEALDKAGVEISKNDFASVAPETSEAEADSPAPGPASSGQPAVPPTSGNGADRGDESAGMGEDAETTPIPQREEGNGGGQGMNETEISSQGEQPAPSPEPPESEGEPAPNNEKTDNQAEIDWPKTGAYGLPILAVGLVLADKLLNKSRARNAIAGGLGSAARWAGEKIQSARGGKSEEQESEEQIREETEENKRFLESEYTEAVNSGKTVIITINGVEHEVLGPSGNPEFPIKLKDLETSEIDPWRLDSDDISRAKYRDREEQREAKTEEPEQSDEETRTEIPELEPITDPSELKNFSSVYVLPDYKDVTKTFHNQTVDFKKIYGKPIIFERNSDKNGAPYILEPKIGEFFYIDESDLKTYFGVPRKNDRASTLDPDDDDEGLIPVPTPPAETGSEDAPAEEDSETVSADRDQSMRIESGDTESTEQERDQDASEDHQGESEAVDESIQLSSAIKQLANSIDVREITDDSIDAINDLGRRVFALSPVHPKLNDLKNQIAELVRSKILTPSYTQSDGQERHYQAKTYQLRRVFVEDSGEDKIFYFPPNSDARAFKKTLVNKEGRITRTDEYEDVEQLVRKIVTLSNQWHTIRLATPEEIKAYQ